MRVQSGLEPSKSSSERRLGDARKRLFFLSLLLTAFMSALLLSWLRPRHGIDDADITLVYARNIALGHGYVYFPGGERVEGSTSLSWTLLCALLFWAGAHSLWPLFLLSIGFALVATLVGLELARCAGGDDGADASTLYAACLLVACPSFFVWNSCTLMDVALWSASVCSATWAIVSPTRSARWALPIALLVLVSSRPEGLLLAPAMLALGALGNFLRGAGWRDALKALLPAALATLLASAGLLAFRLWYFADPVPNTYYAKVGDDRVYTALHGCRYVLLFLLRNPLHLAAALAALAVLRRDGAAAWARCRSGGPALSSDAVVRLSLTFVLSVALLLPLIEGEDHFVAYRMMQPFVPLSCALLGSEAWRWLRIARVRKRLFLLGASIFVLFGWTRLFAFEAQGFRKELGLAESGRLLAERLEQRLDPARPLPTIGVTMAGGIAFGYHGRVLDLLGLNWRKMAHASRDRHGRPGHASFSTPVFWSEPASLVLPRFRAEAPRDVCDLYSAWENEILHGLLTSDAFRRAYVGVSLLAPEGHLIAYARRDWLEQNALWGARRLEWPPGGALPPACSTTLHDAKAAQQMTQ
jgi:hypothetical protein